MIIRPRRNFMIGLNNKTVKSRTGHKQKHKSCKNQKGLALIELVVSVSIFAVIMIAVTGVFQIIVSAQRNTIAAQNIQESFRYALEVMSKEIRNAQKDAGVCNTAPINVPNNSVYAINAGGDLIFKNKNGLCVRYYLSGNQLKITRGADDYPITPSSVSITSLNFIVNGSATVQPSVTLLISGYVSGQAVQKESITIQTTIASRWYE